MRHCQLARILIGGYPQLNAVSLSVATDGQDAQYSGSTSKRSLVLVRCCQDVNQNHSYIRMYVEMHENNEMQLVSHVYSVLR